MTKSERRSEFRLYILFSRLPAPPASWETYGRDYYNNNTRRCARRTSYGCETAGRGRGNCAVFCSRNNTRGRGCRPLRRFRAISILRATLRDGHKRNGEPTKKKRNELNDNNGDRPGTRGRDVFVPTQSRAITVRRPPRTNPSGERAGVIAGGRIVFFPASRRGKTVSGFVERA